MPTTQPPVLICTQVDAGAATVGRGWHGRFAVGAVALASLALPVPDTALGFGNMASSGIGATPRTIAGTKADVRPIDINSASKPLLKTLPGVDDATAERIIAARPYPSKAKLVAAQVMSDAQFQSLKHRIVAVQPPAQRPLAKQAAPVAGTRP